MTIEQLRSKFPHASSAFIKANTGDSGSSTGIQERQADQRPAVNNRPRHKSANGSNHQQYRVTIILRYSDRRRRDVDGAASTLLDAITSARRLLDGYTGTARHSQTEQSRGSGGDGGD